MNYFNANAFVGFTSVKEKKMKFNLMPTFVSVALAEL